MQDGVNYLRIVTDGTTASRQTAIVAIGDGVTPTRGTFYGCRVYNSGASAVYVKFYDYLDGIAPLGATPFMTITAASGAVVDAILPFGVNFSIGLGARCVSTAIDTGNLAAPAGASITVLYKS